MEAKTYKTETTKIFIKEIELNNLIKNYLKEQGVENTDKHVVIDFVKEFQDDCDRWVAEIVIKKYD